MYVLSKVMEHESVEVLSLGSAYPLQLPYKYEELDHIIKRASLWVPLFVRQLRTDSFRIDALTCWR
jgi:hypothetical protein